MTPGSLVGYFVGMFAAGCAFEFLGRKLRNIWVSSTLSAAIAVFGLWGASEIVELKIGAGPYAVLIVLMLFGVYFGLRRRGRRRQKRLGLLFIWSAIVPLECNHKGSPDFILNCRRASWRSELWEAERAGTAA